MLLQYYNVISKLLIEQGLICIFCIVMSIKSVKMLIKLKLYFSLFITAKKKRHCTSYFLPNPFAENINSLGNYYNQGQAIEIVSKLKEELGESQLIGR